MGCCNEINGRQDEVLSMFTVFFHYLSSFDSVSEGVSYLEGVHPSTKIMLDIELARLPERSVLSILSRDEDEGWVLQCKLR